MRPKYSCPTCHKRALCECVQPDYSRWYRETDHAPSTHAIIAQLVRVWEHRAMVREVEENRREEIRDRRRERREGRE